MNRGADVIILIGMMGSGKTTVGRELAERLSFTLWDTDRMIEEGAGRCVRDIFADEGEEVFRKLETRTLRLILDAQNAQQESFDNGVILSTGGGLPVRRENRELLKQIGCVVYLKTSASEAAVRLAGDHTRPLLEKKDREEGIRALLEERAPLYEEAADLIVDTDHRTPGQVADAILKLLSTKGE